MSLTLAVDGERWRGHLRSVAATTPGLVPVAKGNGYGFGRGRLARKAQWLADQGLGVDTLAVGTYEELPEVASRFAGSLLVLTPWRPWVADLDPGLARRVVHTVGRLDDLAALRERDPAARVVLERLTSMKRHGFSGDDLRTALASGRHEGVAVHLPLAAGAHLPEVERLLGEAGNTIGALWVSHLTADELGRLRSAYPSLVVRPRVGTALWLGDRDALQVTATVLDVHPVARGEAYGYRGRRAPRAGHLVVVSGGTAHGIGLEAPTGQGSVRARAATVARGSLDALGRVRSPFTIDGEARLFAEPPHMQASMLFLPAGARVPAVGDRVPVRVRFTATDVDRVEIT
ncbi:alanine racemase [Nocardioides sp. SYSU D00038]|uniref:alanine racemase n=1 Tax=Nocardioides sp. SYSU D00038 TaxID=2812554 RepID=UPI00196850E4|nr:alanine racemase [Nocardioides sp. SYSU D00038]